MAWCCCRIDLEWQRGQLFDSDVAGVFQRIVADSGSAKVVSVVNKEERRHRPHGESPVQPWRGQIMAAIAGM